MERFILIMERFRLIEDLFLRKIINADEYRTAMTKFLEGLSPDETKRIFTNPTLCPHFYQEYTEDTKSDPSFSHWCQLCGKDFTLKDVTQKKE